MIKSETQAPQGGTLYVVATPIGNLGDISIRATKILSCVQVIAAEDTRHTRILLNHLGIHQPRMIPLHEHNEAHQVLKVLRLLQSGEEVALVSDAGTPLISDPGYRLVCETRRHNLPVSVIPGPSAVTAALSVSGLGTDRFVFEGFLPARAAARRSRLQALSSETRTQVFFESPRRICNTIDDMVSIFGPERPLALCRELTKRFETVLRGSAAEILTILLNDSDQCRGEMVLVVGGSDQAVVRTHIDEERLLDLLAGVLTPRVASEVAARLTGGRKNDYYARMLQRTRTIKDNE